MVGQNVPFVTGQYTNNNSNSGAVNPFQTVERKDVGLTLKVKPQISDTGTVKLTIYQEVSSVNSSRKDIDGLVTNKRSIESNILVADGAVVVLGGLLSDTYEDSRQQVPGLGDMPFFGNLFRNESRSRNKTNLMIFLRPVVVRDDNSAEVLSSGRYEQMQGLQKDADKPETPVLPDPQRPGVAALPAQRQRTRPTDHAPPAALRLRPRPPAVAGGRWPPPHAVACRCTARRGLERGAALPHGGPFRPCGRRHAAAAHRGQFMRGPSRARPW